MLIPKVNFNNAMLFNYGTYRCKLHMEDCLSDLENTPDMKFVSLGAMVVTLRGVVVGDFPIHASFRVPGSGPRTNGRGGCSSACLTIPLTSLLYEPR